MGVLDRALTTLRLKKPQPASKRTRQDVLNAIPVRNSLVEWKKEETGEVSLIIPADGKKVLRWLIRVMDLPDKRVVTLDAVGSFVWEACDGESTFETVSAELSAKFNMTRRESEASLAEFFRVLGKRGLLGFTISEDAARKLPSRQQAARRGGSKRKGRR